MGDSRRQPSSERLLERLKEESLQLQRRSFDSADAGISANLCEEAIDRIEYLEARVAILDFCSSRVDCLVRGEAMKQKDGS